MKPSGTNGSSSATPQILAALAALQAALTPPVQETPAPAPVKRPRKPRKVVTVATSVPGVVLQRTVPDPDHQHTCYQILEAVIPDAEHCASHRPGAGVILRVACACGCVGTLEIPAADAEVMAQTACWEGEG